MGGLGKPQLVMRRKGGEGRVEGLSLLPKWVFVQVGWKGELGKERGSLSFG